MEHEKLEERYAKLSRVAKARKRSLRQLETVLRQQREASDGAWLRQYTRELQGKLSEANKEIVQWKGKRFENAGATFLTGFLVAILLQLLGYL